MSAGLGLNIVLATAGKVKNNKSHDIDAWGFDQLSSVHFPNVASIGAGVASTAIQTLLFIPQAFKIAKVGIYCSAIDATAGDKINIVFGTAAETGTTVGADTQRVYGYPTVVATAGQSVFSADLEFNTTNFPNLTTGSGGFNTFTPYNYDGIYIPTDVMTIRVVTNASTGSISNLRVSLALALIDTNPSYSEGGTPGTDW